MKDAEKDQKTMENQIRKIRERAEAEGENAARRSEIDKLTALKDEVLQAHSVAKARYEDCLESLTPKQKAQKATYKRGFRPCTRPFVSCFLGECVVINTLLALVLSAVSRNEA